MGFNLAAPLQRRHGALPVVWRAQLVAVVLVLPVAIASIPASEFAWSSLLASVALGATLNDEPVHAAALMGTALVLGGAYVTSRPKRVSAASA